MSKIKPKLSIVIPTYNRNETLVRNLHSLIPQITNDCELIIIDNASNVPVSDSLVINFGIGVLSKLTIIRNLYNIGGNDNISKGFEFANGDFVWVLGDDDCVEKDAVSTVLKKITDSNCALFINFNSPGLGHVKRQFEVVTHGLTNFLKNIDSLGQVIFISDGIFKRTLISENLVYAKFYQNLCAPLFVALILSFPEGGECHFLPNRIIKNSNTKAETDTHISIVPVALGFSLMLNLPLSDVALEILKEKILKTQEFWLTFGGVFHQLLLTSFIENRKIYAINTFQRLGISFFFLRQNPILYFKYKVCLLLLKYPKIGYRLFRFVYRIVRGHSHSVNAYERFDYL